MIYYYISVQDIHYARNIIHMYGDVILFIIEKTSIPILALFVYFLLRGWFTELLGDVKSEIFLLILLNPEF